MSAGESPNAAQAAYWNGPGGERWKADEPILDSQLRAFNPIIVEAAGLAPGDRVVDVGCGWGGLTLDVAQAVAPDGEALGLDISELLVTRARARATEHGVAATFRRADVQTERLEPFDAAVSRHGVMFFDDPVGAFGNIAAALAPGGRLGFVCWQPIELNPWMAEPMAAIRRTIELAPPLEPGAPGPFALGDGERTRSILHRAGFTDVALADLAVDMLVGGGTLEGAVDFAMNRGVVVEALADDADASRRERVASAAREAFRPYLADDGVRMPSRAWLVTAVAP